MYYDPEEHFLPEEVDVEETVKHEEYDHQGHYRFLALIKPAYSHLRNHPMRLACPLAQDPICGL